MTSTDSYLCREAIRNKLAHQAGNAPDSKAVAEAALNTWRQVVARLSPVIGTSGVEVLVRRSLHMTTPDFPWFAIAGEHGENGDLFEKLTAKLMDRETDVAAEASYALLITFTELLTTLIGESLTGSLLGPVLSLPSPTSEQETAS